MKFALQAMDVWVDETHYGFVYGAHEVTSGIIRHPIKGLVAHVQCRVAYAAISSKSRSRRSSFNFR